MRADYKDIRDRIDAKPTWFDEEGVPRYCVFSPDQCANIYARQCLLMSISCQSCQHPFLVALSWNMGLPLFCKPLSELVESGDIHYGDPPNVGCCPAGPTMNSVPHQVLEFWQQNEMHQWQRVAELERPIDCAWYGGGAADSDEGRQP